MEISRAACPDTRSFRATLRPVLDISLGCHLYFLARARGENCGRKKIRQNYLKNKFLLIYLINYSG